MRPLGYFRTEARRRLSDIPTTFGVDYKIDEDMIETAIDDANKELSIYIPRRQTSKVTINAAPDVDYFTDGKDISGWAAGGTATLLYNTLSPARNITLTIYDPNHAITALVITITGKAFGTAQTRSLTLADFVPTDTGWLLDDPDNMSEVKLFSYLTSVVATSVTGVAAGCTLDIGYGKYCYQGFSLPTYGDTTMLDWTTARDKYGVAMFKDVNKFVRVAYPYYESTTVSPWRGVEDQGEKLAVGYDSTITVDYDMLVDWCGKHTIGSASSTMPSDADILLVEGIVAFVYMQVADKLANQVNDGASVPPQWRTSGYARYSKWQGALIANRTRITGEMLPRS
jgi:hypothetical protein